MQNIRYLTKDITSVNGTITNNKEDILTDNVINIYNNRFSKNSPLRNINKMYMGNIGIINIVKNKGNSGCLKKYLNITL